MKACEKIKDSKMPPLHKMDTSVFDGHVGESVKRFLREVPPELMDRMQIGKVYLNAGSREVHTHP